MTTSMRRLTAVGALAATAAGATALAATATGQSDPGAPEGDAGQAKNIILFIGDGMGTTHVDAARLRYYGAAGALNMERLPHHGTVSTYSVEEGTRKPDYVTDSASSATAWASGVKTYDAALGKDAFKRVVPTLMELADESGMRTGNVSTAEITDATPAGMVSHVSRRTCQGPGTVGCTDGDKPVAEQIAESTTADVILGGGLSRFDPADEALMRENGYRILGGEGSFGDPALPAQTAATQRVADERDLRGVTARENNTQRVIGLFNRGNLTVEEAKRRNPAIPEADEPSLPEMTSKAVELLSRSREGRENGFFLQVEGALIDKRSHANDAAQTLGEMKAFDDAVRRAVEFAREDGNTLVIVTADHECAGFNIIEQGSITNAEATTPPSNVDSGNTANNSTPTRPAGGTRDATRSTGAVNGAGAGDARNFGPATFRTPDDPDGVRDGSPEASLWLSYLSGNHTGQDVQIFATGPESTRFRGQQDNTDLFYDMRDALTTLSAAR